MCVLYVLKEILGAVEDRGQIQFLCCLPGNGRKSSVQMSLIAGLLSGLNIIF